MRRTTLFYRTPWHLVRLISCFLIVAGSGLWIADVTSSTAHGASAQQSNAPVSPSAATTCSGKTILFVGRQTPLLARDQPLVDYLQNLGNTVIVRNQDQDSASDAAGKDLLIISESVYSTEIGSTFRDVTVPILTWEAWLYDDMGMTGPVQEQDYGEVFKAKEIRITNSAHPLAAGLSDKVVTLENTKDDERFQWGVPNNNAVTVAVVKIDGGDDGGDGFTSPVDEGDDEKKERPAIFAYEAGATMVGMTAPARRVGFHNASGDNLTEEGWQLFDAAVAWAMNCANDTPPAGPYRVSITIDGEGTVLKVPNQETYEAGTFVMLMAGPAAGWRFHEWSGDLQGNQNPDDIQVTRDMFITAHFQMLTPPATGTPVATVTPHPTATPAHTSTAAPTATRTPAATPTATPTAEQTPSSSNLSAQMKDNLAVDADNDDLPSPGDTLQYTIELVNHSNDTIREILVENAPVANTALVQGSLYLSQGSVLNDGTSRDGRLLIEIGTLEKNGGRAEIRYEVRVNNPLPASATRIRNQATVSGAELPDTLTDDPDIDGERNATITEIHARPQLRVTKTDLLMIDADANELVSANDTLIYVITLVNEGNIGAADLRLEDVPDASTTLITGSVQVNDGTVVFGNTDGDFRVQIDIDELDGGGATLVASLQVMVRANIAVDQIYNQATVSFKDEISGADDRTLVLSDDPETSEISDATLTQVNEALDGFDQILYMPLAVR